MKLSKLRRQRRLLLLRQRRLEMQRALPGQASAAIPVVVTRAFAKLRLAQRARVLRMLLTPVGPMALAVLGGGEFAKFVAQARWPGLSVSLGDAARVTSSQLFELVRYVEQSHPQALQQVLLVLTRDPATLAAAGASLAFVLMRQRADRQNSRVRLPSRR